LSLIDRRPPQELVERQIGNGPGARIHDDLVGAPEQPLHGLQIHALARDVGRLLVFVVDLQEARRRALGLGHRLLTIGFRVLHDLRGASARFRHDLVGVALRLVLHALGVGARGLHVAESVDHLRGRIDLL
jgi:hypothetical protein